MDDLVQFLRARLDEDEQTARDAQAEEFCKNGRWVVRGPFGQRRNLGSVQSEVSEAILGEDADDVPFAFADHIARHDPARVLAEVEAWRALLKEHDSLLEGVPDDFTGVWALEAVMRSKATVYSDHPDYRDDWRP